MKYLKKLLKVYTYEEIAEGLGYRSRSTICNWIKINKIPKRKVELVKELSIRILGK